MSPPRGVGEETGFAPHRSCEDSHNACRSSVFVDSGWPGPSGLLAVCDGAAQGGARQATCGKAARGRRVIGLRRKRTRSSKLVEALVHSLLGAGGSKTGIVRDRSRTDGAPASPGHRLIGSIASTGFGLTGLCIAAERGWLPRDQLVQRARTTLTFFAERAYQNHGWFYHWLNIRDGRARVEERGVVDRHGALDGRRAQRCVNVSRTIRRSSSTPTRFIGGLISRGC